MSTQDILIGLGRVVVFMGIGWMAGIFIERGVVADENWYHAPLAELEDDDHMSSRPPEIPPGAFGFPLEHLDMRGVPGRVQVDHGVGGLLPASGTPLFVSKTVPAGWLIWLPDKNQFLINPEHETLIKGLIAPKLPWYRRWWNRLKDLF